MSRRKEIVDGGMVFCAATGDWTFRLTDEIFWRDVHYDSRHEALDALHALSNRYLK